MSLRDYLFYEEPGITLYCGDALEVLGHLQAQSVDAILCDPPYNAKKKYGQHDDDMEPAEYQVWLQGLLAACARVTVDPVVFFPGTKNVLSTLEILPPGLKAHRILGWHRKEFAGDKWNGGPAMSWEPIIWASTREKPAFNRLFGTAGRDFLVVNSTHGDPFSVDHPCPKPLRVMKWLVGLFVPDGGIALDPTCGTGTTLEACKESGRCAIGIESEPRYCDLAVKRLRQEVLAL